MEKPKPKPEYMKKHIELCQAVCMWPVQQPNRQEWICYNGTVFFVTASLFLLLTPLTLKIFSDFQDMDGVATVIDFATVVASGTFRYVYIYARAEKYEQLIESMNEKFVDESFYPIDNKMNMDKYIKVGKYMGIVYVGSAAVWILQMCFAPIITYLLEDLVTTNVTFERGPPLVFEASYPFEVTTQPNHGLAYLFQVVGFLLLGYIYLIIDAFWYMVITLTIGQFALVSHSLRNLNALMEDEEWNADDVEKGLDRCIKQHQLTREFIHGVEDVLSPNVLVDFMHAVLSITFILLDLTIALHNQFWMKAFHLIEYFNVSIVHMFLFDWLGNELVLREAELGDAAYDTPWHELPKSFRTKIFMIITQSRHPYRLTGGGMYHMCLEFFVGTVKMIFSYFMFLFQMRNKAN